MEDETAVCLSWRDHRAGDWPLQYLSRFIFEPYDDSATHKSVHHSECLPRHRHRRSRPFQAATQNEIELRSGPGEWNAERERRRSGDTVLPLAGPIISRRAWFDCFSSRESTKGNSRARWTLADPG